MFLSDISQLCLARVLDFLFFFFVLFNFKLLTLSNTVIPAVISIFVKKKKKKKQRYFCYGKCYSTQEETRLVMGEERGSAQGQQ